MNMYRFQEREAAIFKLKSNTLHNLDDGSDVQQPQMNVNAWKDASFAELRKERVGYLSSSSSNAYVEGFSLHIQL